MNLLEQIKGSANQLIETVGDGWTKLVAKSGQALTRFTRRQTATEEGTELPEVVESWGMLAGEVAETGSHLIVRLEAPGMDKSDFDIQVEHGTLTIRGEKRFERERREASYHVFEAAYGAFERSLPLPREVDAERAEAQYSRGVLTVRFASRLSARRMSTRPQRSGAESANAPNIGLSAGVWKGPAPSGRAGSSVSRSPQSATNTSCTRSCAVLPSRTIAAT